MSHLLTRKYLTQKGIPRGRDVWASHCPPITLNQSSMLSCHARLEDNDEASYYNGKTIVLGFTPIGKA